MQNKTFYVTGENNAIIEQLKLFDESTSNPYWKSESGCIYPLSKAGNIMPVTPKNKTIGVRGYLKVEVTDPQLNKGVFLLYSMDDCVSIGESDCYTGSTIELDAEITRLENAPLIEPEDGFRYIILTIDYMFNEGPVIEDTIAMYLHSESEIEENYHWKVL